MSSPTALTPAVPMATTSVPMCPFQTALRAEIKQRSRPCLDKLRPLGEGEVPALISQLIQAATAEEQPHLHTYNNSCQVTTKPRPLPISSFIHYTPTPGHILLLPLGCLCLHLQSLYLHCRKHYHKEDSFYSVQAINSDSLHKYKLYIQALKIYEWISLL